MPQNPEKKLGNGQSPEAILYRRFDDIRTQIEGTIAKIIDLPPQDIKSPKLIGLSEDSESIAADTELTGTTARLTHKNSGFANLIRSKRQERKAA